MHHALCLSSFIIGVCLTSRANAAEPMNKIFKLVDEPELGSPPEPGLCDLYSYEAIIEQFEDMQKAAKLLAGQTTEGPDIIPNQNTASLAKLLVEFGPDRPTHVPQMMRKRLEIYVHDTNDLLARERNFHSSKLPDMTSLVLCGSTGIEVKKADDAMPGTRRHRTMGQMFDGSQDDEHCFYWIPAIVGSARILKTALPPIPDDHKERVDICSYYGPSFCTDSSNYVWSMIATRFAGSDSRTTKRAVFVLCSAYFKATQAHNPNTLLPNKLDLSHQKQGTRLSHMQPAWLLWYAEIVKVAGTLSTRHKNRVAVPSYVRWWDGWTAYIDSSPPRLPDNLDKKQFKDRKHKIATTADECMQLALWQGAKDTSLGDNLSPSNMPALNNPANIAWLAILVTLQMEGYEPQSWRTGKAGGLLPPNAYPECDNEDGGGEWGGAGQKGEGSGGRSGKRPLVGGGKGSLGKRPRVGAAGGSGGGNIEL